MIQIDDVVISFDVFREKFLCNLDACKGECCIEGDAGAPVELEEVEKLEEVLPVIWDELSPEARAVIDKQGVVYTDEEGDLVTRGEKIALVGQTGEATGNHLHFEIRLNGIRYDPLWILGDGEKVTLIPEPEQAGQS